MFSTRKFQFPLPLLTHQPSSTHGTKALVQLNRFLCCSILRAFNKGSLSCSYYTRDSGAVPTSALDEPSSAQPHRPDQRTAARSAQNGPDKFLSISGYQLYLRLSSPQASQRNGALLKCVFSLNPAMLR